MSGPAVTGRCAVVTGPSSGVGKSAARMLAEQGWHVIAHGRDEARGAAALAGEAKTNFAAHAEPGMATMIEAQNEVSPDVGGGTLAWLAAAPETGAITGGYFYGSAPADAAPAAADDADALRLWDESEKLLARSGF